MSRNLLAIVAALTALTALAASGAEQVPAKPRLAIVVVVDGLSWDRLSSWRPWLTNGLKRLLDEGAVATQCRYPHNGTYTSPGHASIATGAPPRIHGVPLNQWPAPAADGSAMLSIYSASQPLPGQPEHSPKTVTGPGRLRVPTLADRLAATRAGARVVSIANKDRSAVLLAGRDPRHAVYWYSEGTYVTSPAYDAASPSGAAAARVIARFNGEKAGARLAARVGSTWSRLPLANRPPALGAEGGLAKLQDPVIGPVFPHRMSAPGLTLTSSILWTPHADRLLTDLALDLLDDDALALGRDDVPDLLALSYSVSDYVSHDYGPESVEELEVIRSLDLEIGRLIDRAIGRAGKDRVVVALSADHGFLPLRSITARVPESALKGALNAAVDAELKRPKGAPLVHRVAAGTVWLDKIALAAPGAPDAASVLRVVQRELAGRFKQTVERVAPAELAAPPAAGDELAHRVWNALVPGRSGDLIVVPRFGVLLGFDSPVGTSHGSLWEYDTHVPLIFWGAGVAPREITTPSTPYDLAPTLAGWLGVTLPDATGTRR